ncbi:MAG: TIGR03013 family PEP-CTERM/XrtA system glycosyltransferase [Dokdonella sp.]|jgi:sugar transferase (PEP-CTERM system associated)|nr:TIGR03013 family PEP-CTERM/XrtA system glycosyltransferase [Dokdonella sp.]
MHIDNPRFSQSAGVPAGHDAAHAGSGKGRWMLRFLRDQANRWLIALATGEGLLLALSLWLAVRIRYWYDHEWLSEYSGGFLLRSLVFGAVIVLAMAALGLYQPRMRERLFGVLARQAIGFLLGGIGLALLYYVVPHLYIGRGVAGIGMLIGFVAVATYRAAFMRLIDVEALKRRVLVLGSGRRASMISSRMRRRVDRRGFAVVGFLPMEGETPSVPADTLLRPGTPLSDFVQQRQIAEIVVGSDDRRGSLPMAELLECKQNGVMITDLPTFFERELGKVQLDLVDPSWLVFSDGFNASPLRRFSKRVFDVVAALLVLVPMSPFMLLTALAIRIESGWRAPVLYRQERVGERGQVFSLAKFRSMRPDAEKNGVAVWAAKNDDRVTRVGRFIRKTRLDELPQLWNILRGDMSLIGPRPERPQFVDELAKKIRYYQLRHCVKPGLAGWAQLNFPYGATEEDAAEKLKYDLFYVKNHNLLLDAAILLQTLEVVLFGRGAR